MTIMLLRRQLLWHTCIYAHNHTFFIFQKTRCNGSETLPRKKQKQFLTYKKKKKKLKKTKANNFVLHLFIQAKSSLFRQQENQLMPLIILNCLQ